jgi:hypothetical protein
METSYIADFHSFHHEFREVRDEVLQSLARNYISDGFSAMSSQSGLAGMFLHSDHTQSIEMSNIQNDVSQELQLDADLTASEPASVQSSRRDKKIACTKTRARDRSQTPSHCNRAVARPRKGHKKSRRGCFSCKQRKIKVSTNVCSRNQGPANR